MPPSKLSNDLIACIDQTRLVDTLKEMVTIRSENPFDGEPRAGFREKEIAEFYMDQMAALGMKVSSRDVVPGRPNVWGTITGDRGPSLMLAGHLDTVSTEGYDKAYDVEVKDGRVYGRGTCDMKAALAAYLEVVRLIREADLKLDGDLILCGVADEEYRMIGSKDIGRNGPFADQGIIGEPTGLTVCSAHKGQLSTTIRTFGKAVHSSIPEQGVNAIVHMARVINAFSDYNVELARRTAHPLCGHGRFSPGVIHGGELVSTVPDYCELEVDRRTVPGETTDQVFDEYERRLARLRDEDPDFRYEISSPHYEIPCNDVPIDEPVVQSLLKNYHNLTGVSTEPSACPGATDAPNMGFPCVVCGPGSLTQAHSTNEYVEIVQMALATKMYLLAVFDLVAHH